MANHTPSNETQITEPWVGTRPYEEDDKDIFFGRDYETSELVSLIISHPAVLLYAQSGAGKTSLLKASLIPLLRKRKCEVLPPARVRRQETQSAQVPEDVNIYVYNALEYLSRNHLSADERARMRLTDFVPPKKPSTKREIFPLQIVIFDQFEEIFTVYPERFEDRQNFFEQVSYALEANSLLRVVFAMREDFIAELDPYISILPEKLQTRYRLLRLNEDTARAAIEKPLEKFNQSQSIKYVFEADAADKVVDNLRTIYVKTPNGDKPVLGPFIEPVHLQVVCRNLLRRKLKSLPENTELNDAEQISISEDDVTEFGDVNQSLSEFYEESIQRAVETAREKKSNRKSKLTEGVLRAWFGRTLITPEGTRSTVFGGRKDETVGGIPKAVIDELELQRLIRSELRGGELWYELSHDRLIQPIKDANERWLLKQPAAQKKGQDLEAQAAEWARLGKNRGLLLSQSETQDARQWVDSPQGAGIGYSDTLFAFIQASQAARQQQRVRQLVAGSALLVVLLLLSAVSTVYAFQQRGEALKQTAVAVAAVARAEERSIAARDASEAARLSEANAIAEKKLAVEAEAKALEQQKAADAARAEADNQRLAATSFAAKEKDERIKAEQAKVVAEQAKMEAQAAKVIAETQKAFAETQRAFAEQQRMTAQSREVAASALSKLQSDPELSVLLSMEAIKIKNTDEAEAALRASAPLLSNTKSSLRGHSELVKDAIFIGKDAIATSSIDGTARLWNISGKMIKNMSLSDVTFSENGNFAIGVDYFRETVQVQEVKSGEAVGSVDGDGIVAALALSADGKLAATGRDNLVLQVWESNTSKIIKTIDLTKEYGKYNPTLSNILNLVISPDKRFLAVFISHGNDTGSVDVFEIARAGWYSIRLGGKQTTSSMAFSPDSQLLAISDNYGTAVWNVSKQQKVSLLSGHFGAVTSISFSPDGRLLVTTSTDNTARVWKTNTWSNVVLQGHVSVVQKASFSPDSKYVVTASLDNTARLWHALTGQNLVVLGGHSGPVNNARFSPDGLYIVTASADKSARVWIMNLSDDGKRILGDGLVELKGHTKTVYDASYGPDGNLVATSSFDGTIRIWEARTGQIIRVLNASLTYQFDASFSPDGTRILTSGADGMARVWEVTTGRLLLELKADKTSVWAAVFSPDAKMIATANVDQTVRLWDTRKGEKIGEDLKAPSNIVRLKFSPDGKYIIGACFDKTAIIWDVGTRKIAGRLTGHTQTVFDAEFSPNGKYIATASDDTNVIIWDAATRESLRVLSGHKAGLLNLSFSHDGKYVVTASRDGTARVWEVETGKVVAVLSGQANQLRSASFSPDDTFIVTASDDGIARIYPKIIFAPLDTLLQLASERVTRTLTSEERKQYLHQL